ncbi:hypothetical protein [Streptomyces sp. NPDC002994]|uniref:hypothetical protein n=1 Tax=Streptomyces sp. NPDC002994 TaxID=3154441 RepID=UPI0033B4C82D
MSEAAEQPQAAPELLKLTVHFLPEWLVLSLGAAVLLLVLGGWTRKRWRTAAGPGTAKDRPAD